MTELSVIFCYFDMQYDIIIISDSEEVVESKNKEYEVILDMIPVEVETNDDKIKKLYKIIGELWKN